jgi:hypothetical protein
MLPVLQEDIKTENWNKYSLHVLSESASDSCLLTGGQFFSYRYIMGGTSYISMR